MKGLNDPRRAAESAAADAPIWALIDELDAVTNGLSNPEAAARLAGVDEPEFAPWRALVAALRAFYADDPASCLAAVDAIPLDAAPAVLAPLFRAWAAAGGPLAGLGQAPASLAALYGRLMLKTHPLAALAEQADEALAQGMVEHFEALAGRVMRDLHELRRANGPRLAIRYARKCLADLDAAGSDDVDFFAVVLRSLGRPDGFFALGLALTDRDPAAAAAAFRAALASPPDGGYLAPALRGLLEAAAGRLEAEAEAAARPADPTAPGPDFRPATAKASRRPPHPDQLDLFGGSRP
jgi:hypothetical protein